MQFIDLKLADLAVIFLCATTVQAHSWIEQLRLIASNGTFVGTPGYPRGFVPRTSPDFSDSVSQNHIPPDGRSTGYEILPTDLMCSPSQVIGNQTAGSPALTAAPGDNIALIYEENGHVTLLDRSPTKPVGSGTMFIYGTKTPSNKDTYLGIHRVWNTAGTGGDKRGKLLATRHFDDGQCFQNNTSNLAKARRAEFNPIGNDLNCQADVQLPQEAGTSGTYTLYWVWEWPTLDKVTGAAVTNESYTTCMDINMTSEKLPDSGSFNSEQAVDYRAIQAELSTAFLVNPTAAEQLTKLAGSGAEPTSAPVTSVPATFVPPQVSATSKAAGGFVTVTVTGDPKTQLETVTATVFNIVGHIVATSNPVQPGTSQVMSTVTISPLPLSSPTSTNASPSSLQSTISSAATTPAIQPFLTPESKSISVNSISSASSSSTIKSPTNPSASTIKTLTSASSTRILTPSVPSSITLPGGVFRLRGRVFRR